LTVCVASTRKESTKSCRPVETSMTVGGFVRYGGTIGVCDRVMTGGHCAPRQMPLGRISPSQSPPPLITLPPPLATTAMMYRGASLHLPNPIVAIATLIAWRVNTSGRAHAHRARLVGHWRNWILESESPGGVQSSHSKFWVSDFLTRIKRSHVRSGGWLGWCPLPGGPRPLHYHELC